MFSDSFYPVIGGRENVIDNLMREYCSNKKNFLLCPKIGDCTNDINMPYSIFRAKSLRVTKTEYLTIIDKKTKRMLKEKILAGEIDIIHTQTKYALAKYAIKLGKKYNIPVVTTCHTYYPEIYKTQLKFPPLYKIFIRHAKKIINKMDKVFTVSEFMKNKLIDMGITRDIVVIPNGNDLIKFSSQKGNTSKLKEEYNIKTNHILTFVGRINAVKNIEFLLESAKILKLNNLDFHLLIIGNGDIEKYSAIANSLDLNQNVTFTGAIMDRAKLAAIYELSDLNLQPSLTETFGLTIREAAATSTPSVVLEKQATAESITNNLNGFISPISTTAFAETILSALSNPELKSIGTNAKNTLCYSWANVAKTHITEYEKLLKNRRI